MTETVRLSQPLDFLAIVPYLLGFHPTLSLVILTFRGDALISGIRQDLPEDQEDTAHTITSCLDLVTRAQADQVAVIGYGPAGQATPVLDDLRTALAPLGILLIEMLRCHHGRYWSHLADNPPGGTPYDITTSSTAATAVVAGLYAFPDRHAFASCLHPVTGPDRDAIRKATRTARSRATALLTTAPAEYWYKEGLRRINAALCRTTAHEPSTPQDVAWLSLLLTSILIRDSAMTCFGHAYPAPAHIALWTDLVRRAEPGYLAAPATLLAVAAYGSGAGTLARIAVDRALADDAEYSMARLLDHALTHGVPPSAIHDMHAEVTPAVIEEQAQRCPQTALPKIPAPAEGR